MKTATTGHGTIAKRMENAGLAYEIVNPMQVVTFVTTGGPWVAVAQYEHRVFVGFYRTRELARIARNRAMRIRGVGLRRTRVIHNPSEED